MMPDRIVQYFELNHTFRTIWMDGRKLPEEPPFPRWMGWNVGRWEGDTLVVETTNFTDRTSIGGNGNGLRHTEAMRLTEYLTRISDSFLLYDVTMDDPKTYTKPWTMVLPLISPPGFQILPYECHEANGAVKYSLSGAREYDHAVKEALARGLPPPPPPTTDLPAREE
jgi:hypothetical protein